MAKKNRETKRPIAVMSFKKISAETSGLMQKTFIDKRLCHIIAVGSPWSAQSPQIFRDEGPEADEPIPVRVFGLVMKQMPPMMAEKRLIYEPLIGLFPR
jgi:hypothetical protein